MSARTTIRRGIGLAADHAEAAIAAAHRAWRRWPTRSPGSATCSSSGSGGAYPAALEAALKLKEMAIMHAEGTESWEMASGVATIVDMDSVVIALTPDGPGRDSTLDVATHAAAWGARVIEVAPRSSIAGAATCSRSPRTPRRTTHR